MVAAVHFYATQLDERMLLDYVLSSVKVKLFSWAKMDVMNPSYVDRESLPKQSEFPQQQRYGIIDLTLGPICFIEQQPVTYEEKRFKSFAFNRLNWDAVKPVKGQGLVDRDRTPALFWERGSMTADGRLGEGNIGSQASAMDDISPDYRKWVNRVMNWVRRSGTKVASMGLATSEAAGLDLEFEFMNSIFALPDALAYFRAGGRNRKWFERPE